MKNLYDFKVVVIVILFTYISKGIKNIFLSITSTILINIKNIYAAPLTISFVQSILVFQ